MTGPPTGARHAAEGSPGCRNTVTAPAGCPCGTGCPLTHAEVTPATHSSPNPAAQVRNAPINRSCPLPGAPVCCCAISLVLPFRCVDQKLGSDRASIATASARGRAPIGCLVARPGGLVTL